MNREEALSIWAPPDSPWSRWTKAVLFGFMPDDLPELRSAVSELLRVPFSQGTALFVELAGAEGVEFGVTLARSGYQPIPLYNACPYAIDVFGVQPAASGVLSVINVVPIMSALEREANTLKRLAVPASAPPAFLLDANRQRAVSAPCAGSFDNRSIIRYSDVPTAAFLKGHGIREVIVVQAKPDLQSDLRAVLLVWQDGGLTISRQLLTEPWNPQLFTVAKPMLLKAWWDKLRVRFGYPLNEAGSFGRFLHPAGG